MPHPTVLRSHRLRGSLVSGVALGFICFVAFFYALGAHDIWGPDEARYTLVAREMAETGEYIVPHLNGGVYLEKPPLVFWLTSLLATYGGFPYETAARLPAACASFATVLLVWGYASRRWDRTVGLLAGIMLATNVQFFWFGRSGMLDSMLTLWTTLATLACITALDAPRRWAPWFGFAGVALALAILTKGPVGLLVPVLTTVSYGWSVKRTRRALVGTVLSITVAILTVLPWWLTALARTGGHYGSLAEIWRQTYGRAVGGYSHVHPVYYYVLQVIPNWLPWALFLPGAIWEAITARRASQWQAWRLPAVWAGIPFVVFSLIAGKRGRYLLPLYPGIAMLLALYLSRFAGDTQALRTRKPLWYGVAVLGLAAVGFGIALVSVPLWAPPTYAAVLTTRHIIFCMSAGLVLVVVGLLGTVATAKRPAVYAFGTVTGIMVLMFGVTARVVLPLADEFKSARTFAAELQQLRMPGQQLILFDSFRADVGFYLHEHIQTVWPPSELRPTLAKNPEALAIVRKKFLAQIDISPRDDPTRTLDVLGTWSVGSKTWLVLRKRTVPPELKRETILRRPAREKL